jgi:hypothetical protein
MPNYRFDIEQNSDEWDHIKVGMFSASSADKLLSGKDTKGYKQLISKIAEERITGKRCENDEFKGNWSTNRGHEFEPIARDDYEFRTLSAVKLVGVAIKDEWCLCSPDGLISDDTLHQIKCPIFSTQKEYLEKSKKYEGDVKKIIPGNYYKQMQFEMYVCDDRKTNIFTSYHPKLKALDIHVPRDEEMQKIIHQRLEEAKADVLNEIDLIKRYNT